MNNCIGIDISKNTFDVHCLSDGSDLHFKYTSDNIIEFVNQLTCSQPELIIMEATGGYETPLMTELQTAGLSVAVINPKRIRDFAKAVGQTAKTDKIDARIIARFGATLRPPVRPVTDKITCKIKSLVARKRQLTDIRTAEKNHTEHSRDEFIKKSIQTVITTTELLIKEIEEQIRSLIAETPRLEHKVSIIQSVKGIGENTAAALISGLPELGTLNRREIAALTGTAPMNRDSGQFRGKRMTGGGRRNIRKVLYMPTLVAIQHNPVIRSYYQRLLSNGKNKMVAVVACMRKIIVTLNSMVAKNETWNPKIT